MGGERAEEIDSFLQTLLATTTKFLEANPAPALDALEAVKQQRDDERCAREAAGRARFVAMDALDEESLWRERVRLRKDAERQRREAPPPPPAGEDVLEAAARPMSPLSAARRQWAAAERERAAAKAEAEATNAEANRHWLRTEWEPHLKLTKERLRAEVAERPRHTEASQEAPRQKNAEPGDASGAASAGTAATPGPALLVAQVARTVAASRGRVPSITAIGPLPEPQRKAPRRSERELEEEAKEAWRQQQECLDLEWARQREVSSTLKLARAAADAQRACLDEQAPAKAEQEHWDALLAKHRLARHQERVVGKPRWGAFAD